MNSKSFTRMIMNIAEPPVAYSFFIINIISIHSLLRSITLITLCCVSCNEHALNSDLSKEKMLVGVVIYI